MTTNDAADEALQIALNLARNNRWPVFFMTADKVPTVKGGCHAASLDPIEIKRMRPGPLVAIATGARSGVDVLDIDLGHEPAARWYAAAQKRLPKPTRMFRTRRGGLHRYHTHAEGVRNSQNKLAFGVDVRGDGGSAIYWYGVGYDCEDHSPIAPWPAWLLECVTFKRDPPPFRASPSGDTCVTDKAICGLLNRVASAVEGERNSLLYWAARRMAEHAQAGRIARNDAFDDLMRAALAAGLEQAKAQATIESAWRTHVGQ